MTKTVINIMVELLSVLALASNQINQGQLSKLRYPFCRLLMAWLVTEIYARKLLGEKGIESAIQRLDRLTLEESKMTVAQTPELVYDLVDGMEAMMGGAHRLLE